MVGSLLRPHPPAHCTESEFCTFADSCFGKDADHCNNIGICTWDSEEDVCVILDEDVVGSKCHLYTQDKCTKNNFGGQCEWNEEDKTCKKREAHKRGTGRWDVV